MPIYTMVRDALRRCDDVFLSYTGLAADEEEKSPSSTCRHHRGQLQINLMRVNLKRQHVGDDYLDMHLRSFHMYVYPWRDEDLALYFYLDSVPAVFKLNDLNCMVSYFQVLWSNKCLIFLCGNFETTPPYKLYFAYYGGSKIWQCLVSYYLHFRLQFLG